MPRQIYMEDLHSISLHISDGLEERFEDIDMQIDEDFDWLVATIEEALSDYMIDDYRNHN